MMSSWWAAALRARPRPRIWRARAQGGAAGPGGADQALRRRDPAPADRGFRHSRQPDRGQDQDRADDLAHGPAVDIPIENGLSAWSTASISTNSCASRAARGRGARLTGTFLRIERDDEGTHVVYRDKASGRGERLTASW
jgi:hypothetical protein